MPARDDAGEKRPLGRICEKTREEKRFHPDPGELSVSAHEDRTRGSSPGNVQDEYRGSARFRTHETGFIPGTLHYGNTTKKCKREGPFFAESTFLRVGGRFQEPRRLAVSATSVRLRGNGGRANAHPNARNPRGVQPTVQPSTNGPTGHRERTSAVHRRPTVGRSVLPGCEYTDRRVVTRQPEHERSESTKRSAVNQTVSHVLERTTNFAPSKRSSVPESSVP